MFWVDEITNEVMSRIKKEKYLITDWKTPSGHIHVGSLRGAILHDLIRQGLQEHGKEAIFQWGYDDFDPMDGLPIYIDQKWQKYMGKPLSSVPAPDGISKNFAEQYMQEFDFVLKRLGIKPKITKTSELYKNGSFNESIKLVLDNAAEIRAIYKEISGSDKGEDWYPLQVVCPKCGKIGTTKVTSWDGKEVEFQCLEDLVEWAKGCGYQGKISPFNGNAKLPWKVEWPSKWNIFNSDVEGEGKDHSAAGGSRSIANEIYKKVFKKQKPFDVPYEFILISGAKMSSSKGRGATACDMADFLPANILRFLFTRTRYKRAIDFDPEGETIPLLYDEYDRCLQEFLNNPDSDLARAYYYSQAENSSKNLKYVLRFSKVAYLLQMPKVDIFEYAEKEKASDLSDAEKEEIENRVEIAKKWLEKFAPESFKFNIQENLPESTKNLSAQQKEFLSKIAEIIEEENLPGETLHKKIHEIKKEMNIPPREAFSAIYLSFIGKDSGPQAGWLLASLDKNFVIKRLESATADPRLAGRNN